MVDWHKQANSNIRQLVPYRPGKSHEAFGREIGEMQVVKLASNENPRGPGERVLSAIQAHVQGLHRYPDQGALIQRLSEKLAVPVEYLTIGNGSNDVLDLVARVFLSPGRSAVASAHCFLVYPIVVNLAGASLKTVPTRNYDYDLKAMLAAVDDSTSVLFIANPNNPTGAWVGHKALQEALASLPDHIILVLDEAYLEYGQNADYPNSADLLDRHENLVITRTFSKIYGLASARIGYAISHPAIADLLNRARQPFNANGPALAAAMAALEDDDYVAESVRLNTAGKAQLTAGFAKLQIPFIPGEGNFITFDATARGAKAAEVYQHLLRQGVIVRPLANYEMPEHLRVTVGLPEENERFLEALTAG